jgi:hypothetical protein
MRDEKDLHPEPPQEQKPQGYRAYVFHAHLSYDPMEDLNLPASYEEVLDRFRKLQGDRAWEVLN